MKLTRKPIVLWATAILAVWLTIYSLQSTALANGGDNEDARPVQSCVVGGGDDTGEGVWLSTEGASLIYAELEAERRRSEVLDRTLDIHRKAGKAAGDGPGVWPVVAAGGAGLSIGAIVGAVVVLKATRAP